MPRRQYNKTFYLIAVPVSEMDGATRMTTVEATDIRRAEFKAEQVAQQWNSAVMITTWHRTVQRPKQKGA